MEQNKEPMNRPTYIRSTDLQRKGKSNTMEQRQSFQQAALEQLDIHTQKKKERKKEMNLDTHLTPFTNFHSIWTIDLKVPAEP